MKKLSASVFQDITSLSDTIPAGFRGLFSKSSGLWVKKSDNSEHRLLTSDDYLDITPRRTLTGVISSANYFAFAQTELNHTRYSGVFKITVSGAGGIGHTLYLRVEGDSVYTPFYQADSQTNSQTAALTGIYYIRMVYPKTVNNGYRSFIEFYTYNATARTITVEALDMKGLSLLSTFTASTYSSTYQNIQTPAVVYNGMLSNGTGIFNISGSSDVTYKVYNNNYLAGESLVANDIIFLNDSDSRWYKVLVSNRLIPMGAVIAICLTTYAAGVTVACHSHVLATLQTGFTGTLHKDIYAAGTLDVSGKFKSNGTITGTPSGNAAFIRLGRAAQGTGQILKDNNNDFFVTGNYGLIDKIIKSFNGFKFDAEMLGGYLPSFYAKMDTAFTSFTNIPGNTAPIHAYVIDSVGSVWSDNDIYGLLNNEILDSSPKVLILQPGTYSISSVIDCSLFNLKGIIGLSKHDTFIEIDCAEALTGLTFLENVTLLSTTEVFSASFVVSSSGESNTYIKSVDVVCDDVIHKSYDFIAFQGFYLVENVYCLNIAGVCNECLNISGLTVNNSSLPIGGATCKPFDRCERISNVKISSQDEGIVFNKCTNISNVVADSGGTTTVVIFDNCDVLTNCTVYGGFIAFNASRILSNCYAESSNTGFYQCSQISNSKVLTIATNGFEECNKISSCKAELGVSTGFLNCNKISVSEALENADVGFDSCTGLVNNISTGSTTNYSNAYADMAGLYSVADTPSGGWNC